MEQIIGLQFDFPYVKILGKQLLCIRKKFCELWPTIIEFCIDFEAVPLKSEILEKVGSGLQ